MYYYQTDRFVDFDSEIDRLFSILYNLENDVTEPETSFKKINRLITYIKFDGGIISNNRKL